MSEVKELLATHEVHAQLCRDCNRAIAAILEKPMKFNYYELNVAIEQLEDMGYVVEYQHPANESNERTNCTSKT